MHTTIVMAIFREYWVGQCSSVEIVGGIVLHGEYPIVTKQGLQCTKYCRGANNYVNNLPIICC